MRLSPAARCVSNHVAGRIRRSGLMQTLARDIHRPHPSLLCLPGLMQKPVWDGSEFTWTNNLIESIPAIREEFKAATASGILRNDYDRTDTELALHSATNDNSQEDESWTWMSYIQKGERQGHFAAHCPRTAEALEAIPTLMTGVPFAYAFFSTLRPGASIASHAGPSNLRLRIHVPLDVPPDGSAAITVAGQRIPWVDGQLLAFDDSYVHSVENSGSYSRTILLLDTWQPDISPEERDACVGVFEEAKGKGWL